MLPLMLEISCLSSITWLLLHASQGCCNVPAHQKGAATYITRLLLHHKAAEKTHHKAAEKTSEKAARKKLDSTKNMKNKKPTFLYNVPFSNAPTDAGIFLLVFYHKAAASLRGCCFITRLLLYRKAAEKTSEKARKKLDRTKKTWKINNLHFCTTYLSQMLPLMLEIFCWSSITRPLLHYPAAVSSQDCCSIARLLKRLLKRQGRN